MGEAHFSKGMVVEVCSDDQGLRGAWFIATVLRSPSKRNKVFLEYHTLMVDEQGSKPLREFVNAVNLRPTPPRELHCTFSISDEVDAYHNDGWWEGVVIRVLENSRYLVYFRPGKEELEFEQVDLRIHREWVRGSWVPPMENTEEEAAQMQLKEKKQEIDTRHNEVDVRRSDQARLLLVTNTADIAYEPNTRKQEIEQPIPKSNNTKISPPCKKLEKGEPLEGTLVRADDEKAMATTPTTKGEKPPNETEKEISQPLTGILSTPPEWLSDHLPPSFDQEKFGSVFDCDRWGSRPIVDEFSLSPISNNEGEQHDLSNTQLLCSQRNLVANGEEASHEKSKEISQNLTNIFSIPLEEFGDLLAPNFVQENIESVLDCGRSGSRVSPISSNEREQCGSSKTQVHYSEKNLIAEVEEAPLAKKKDISPSKSDIFSCPSEGLSDPLAQNHGKEKIGNVLDYDRSGGHLETDEVSLIAISNSEGDLCKIQVQCSQEKPVAKGEETLPEAKKDLCQILTTIFSSTSECSTDHFPPNFGKERIGSVLDCERSQSLPSIDEFSSSPISNHEEEECDSFKSQSHLSPLPLSIKSRDQHKLEQDILNEKRRKRPTKQTHLQMKPFLPSDIQVCSNSDRDHLLPSDHLQYGGVVVDAIPNRDDARETDQTHLLHFGNIAESMEIANCNYLLPYHQQCGGVKRDFSGIDTNLNEGSARETDQAHLLQVSNAAESIDVTNGDNIQPSNNQLCGVEIDAQHNQVDKRRSDQARLLLSHYTTDIAYESNTRKQETDGPIPISNNIQILPPRKKPKKGETTKGSFIRADHEKVMPTIPTTKAEEAPLEMKKEKNQNSSDTFSSPPGRWSDRLVTNFEQETIGNVLDSDRSGSHPPTVAEFTMSPVSSNEGEQHDSSRTQVQCSHTNLVTKGEEAPFGKKKEISPYLTDIFSGPTEGFSDPLAQNDGQTEIGSISDCDRAHLTINKVSFSLTKCDSCNTPVQCSQKNLDAKGEEAHLEKNKYRNQILTTIFSDPSEGLTDHLALTFGRGKIGGDLDTDRSETRPETDEFSLSLISDNEEEEHDSSKAQVQYSEKDFVAQALPHSIEGPVEQQCRRMGTGWCCPEITSHEKQQCEKQIGNKKRRERPREETRVLMEPFLASDEQQCRRTGKGWRCPKMSPRGKRYCEKHQVEQDVRNEKRRKRPIEESCLSMEPFLPSDNQQCRRNGKGWRCTKMASSGKRYCDKHQFAQDLHNQKRRKRQSEDPRDEMTNSNADHLLLSDPQQSHGPNGSESTESDQVHLLQVSNGAEHIDVANGDDQDRQLCGGVVRDIKGGEEESDARKRTMQAFFDDFWSVYITD